MQTVAKILLATRYLSARWQRLTKLLFAAALVGLGCVAATANTSPQTGESASGLVRYDSQPGSAVQIDGTSNIHDWTVKGGVIRGFIEADAGFPASATEPGAKPPRVEVTIPVRTLKSQVAVGAKKMDEVMQEHMKMAQWPNIEYRLIELLPRTTNTATAAAYQFDAIGALTVSGVTRTNQMPVAIEPIGQDKIKIAGSTTLKMTDFGIKPPSPTLSLGLIKTGDDVTVRVEWIVARTSSPGSTATAK